VIIEVETENTNSQDARAIASHRISNFWGISAAVHLNKCGVVLPLEIGVIGGRVEAVSQDGAETMWRAPRTRYHGRRHDAARGRVRVDLGWRLKACKRDAPGEDEERSVGGWIGHS